MSTWRTPHGSCCRWHGVDVASWTSEPAAVAGHWIAYRHVADGVPPLWHGAGGTTLRQESGRWHREGEALVQYLALSSDGAWAECVRYERIRTEARVAGERPQPLAAADLGRPDRRPLHLRRWEACGLDPAIAVGDHADSQTLATSSPCRLSRRARPQRRARHRRRRQPHAVWRRASSITSRGSHCRTSRSAGRTRHGCPRFC